MLVICDNDFNTVWLLSNLGLIKHCHNKLEYSNSSFKILNYNITTYIGVTFDFTLYLMLLFTPVVLKGNTNPGIHRPSACCRSKIVNHLSAIKSILLT